MIRNKYKNNHIKYLNKYKKILIIYMMIDIKVYNKKMQMYQS